VEKSEALKKALIRLVNSGKIIRLAKGQFYKPEISEFGKLRPLEAQVVKDLLEDKNRIIGYLTGVSAYNKLGLTTQLSNTIQIGTNIDRKPMKRGNYTIRFIRQKNTITKDNIYLLQILDSIRFIKRIPDIELNKASLRLAAIVKELSEKDRISMVKYALKYNPGTRALAGAIIDQFSGTDITEPLLKTLNPLSVFKYNISVEVLKNKLKWQIS
jgi:hypothetical protein